VTPTFQLKVAPTVNILPPLNDRRDRSTKRYLDHEQKLKASIEKDGILSPPKTIREGDKFRLLTGITRWRCAVQLGLPTIPIQILEGEFSPTDLLNIELNDNDFGAPFGPIELASICYEIMRLNGWSQRDVCAHIPAVKPASLCKAFAIFDGLIPDLKLKLQNGELGGRFAYKLSRIPAEQQLEAWQKTAHMHVDTAEQFFDGNTIKKKAKPKPKPISGEIPGLYFELNVTSVADARRVWDVVSAAITKLEKSGFPLPNLPGLLKVQP
jgi:ParB-like chromosome segregation protein Spo0J